MTNVDGEVKPKKTKKDPTVFAFVLASLRRASYRWPPRYRVFNNARVERGKYKCQMCGKIVGRKDIAMDHKNPIVLITGFDGWDNVVQRLFCSDDGYQAICKEPCHSEKTKAENALRKQHRDYLKAKK